VRKPRPPMLTPRMGVREPAISRARRSMVPSPPNTTSKSTWRVRAAASAQTTAFKRARRAVAASLYYLAAGGSNQASRPFHGIRAGDLLGIPNQSDAFDSVSPELSISTKNSLLPAGPSTGDSVTPSHRRPRRAATNWFNSPNTRW